MDAYISSVLQYNTIVSDNTIDSVLQYKMVLSDNTIVSDNIVYYNTNHSVLQYKKEKKMRKNVSAKITPDLEGPLDYICKLINAPKSNVLSMCLSIVNQYTDKQILMESKAHLPKDGRRKSQG